MKLTLKVWRQKNASDPGRFETYEHPEVDEHMSFLEMLDVLNQRLIERGEEPIAFDHDCREGICGICSLMINGVAHGPERATTVCQLHMRYFKDGDTVTIEPWRAQAFPVIKDLIVDRSAFDRIIQAGGFISVGHRAARRTPTPSRSRSRTPTGRWTRPPASAAGPAWRPARTPRRCCSPRPRSAT